MLVLREQAPLFPYEIQNSSRRCFTESTTLPIAKYIITIVPSLYLLKKGHTPLRVGPAALGTGMGNTLSMERVLYLGGAGVAPIRNY